jgi:hypothetical protein
MAIDGVLVPITMFAMIPIVAIGYPIARAYARRLESRPVSSVPADVAARLERMEQAIDSIAIEVERISEGQRFTTKLLADRVGDAEPQRSPARVPGQAPEEAR